MKKVILLFAFLQASQLLLAQGSTASAEKFEQLDEIWATPNSYRTASGAPGHEYYQQQANYDITVELNDDNQSISGEEVITYINNSPDQLSYLWLQVDQNIRAQNSMRSRAEANKMEESGMSFATIQRLTSNFDGGFKIEYVKDNSGKDLPYTINETMMRVDLPKPLVSKSSTVIKIKWKYNIQDRMILGGRSGYEYFEKEDNYLYTIAQFYPRMAVYNETEGWQHKQFLGRGEFALTFGDFKVSITVPADHLVAATGTLQNESTVLSPIQRERFKKAQTTYETPIVIQTQEEAEKAEQEKSKVKKTWMFEAKNVRDFAFASSRKFIWDAKAVKIGGKTVMAMSYYPKEGNPLWGKYSTEVVAHTLQQYSKHTIDYPYPLAISVNAKEIGMEYPMICFNWGRCEEDGTYSAKTKYRTIGVITHEVGHNFFPMIINSDERQWTWMDEGLNSFVQYLAQCEWDKDFPSKRGTASDIVNYMKGPKNKMVPIMTNSEAIPQFGNNAYGKPAAALNILRETILGRELFDFAFKTYAERWAFKHPTPEDFFRTMEDASGVDLDWFWRGWFYTTDHVDISLDKVSWFKIDTRDPAIEFPISKKENEDKKEIYITDKRNKDKTGYVKTNQLEDFHDTTDQFAYNILDVDKYETYLGDLDEEQKAFLTKEYNVYQLDFSNKGGLVMPIILRFNFTDGNSEEVYLPAEIWRLDAWNISKLFFFKKELLSVVVDPHLETADADVENNHWPRRMIPTRFQLYKNKESEGENEMQRHKRAVEKAKKLEGEAEEETEENEND